MDQDFDDLAGEELDDESGAQDESDALSLLLAENPANRGASAWD